MELLIVRYSSELEGKWDRFIERDSINGTFLNSRNFLNYHGVTKFTDHSLVVYKKNEIAAVIPACEVHEKHKKILFSHKGSTFGGIILNKKFNNVKHIDAIISRLEEYLKTNDFSEIIIKNVTDIFCEESSELIEYFLFKYGYENYEELSFYIDFSKYDNDISSNFTSSKRRDYKYSLRNNLSFKQITNNEELQNFYEILVMSLNKHNTKPVHTFEELMDFKEKRLKEIVEFYGVFTEEKLIAGSMIFKFKDKVFHTQYLASNPNYFSIFPMNFLNYNLIKIAKERGYEYFSFGISTEEKGKVLNYNLAEFKEGFGTKYSLNKTFYKNLKRISDEDV